MNILLTNASPLYGGGEFFVFELAKELRSRGKNVFVSCRASNLLYKKCEETGIILLPLEYPDRGKVFRHCEALRRIIRRYRIRLIHSNTNYDRTVSAFASRFERIPHVTSVHSLHSIQHNLTHWIRNRCATDQFIVDGVCVRNLLTGTDRIDPAGISVVHLGIDPLVMRNDARQRERTRASFGFGPDHVVIGNVARMVPFKGHETLLRAFALVARASAVVRLLLVGAGELLGPMKQLAGDLGIADRTAFAGFRDDLVALYSAFDIYAHCSVEGGGETFPFAVLQALSHELPVVVTRVGDVPEMVEEGVNGYVTREKDEREIARRLSDLADDPGRRIKFGSESRTLLYRRFTIGMMVDRVEKIYNTAINSKI
ncbi:MAG TPA: glycosyltransferase family 4 protein [Bacteroidota bacterium]|nr:glycosyltransferase family 4 protein [Bacteroidota bacterium]